MAHNLRLDIIMPDSVLARLVDCTATRKIGCISDIKRETKWSGHRVDKYGAGAIVILLRCIPL